MPRKHTRINFSQKYNKKNPPFQTLEKEDFVLEINLFY